MILRPDQIEGQDPDSDDDADTVAEPTALATPNFPLFEPAEPLEENPVPKKGARIHTDTNASDRDGIMRQRCGGGHRIVRKRT